MAVHSMSKNVFSEKLFTFFLNPNCLFKLLCGILCTLQVEHLDTLPVTYFEMCLQTPYISDTKYVGIKLMKKSKPKKISSREKE